MKNPQNRVLLITGEGGLGDHSFNDAGFAGAQRAAKELNLSLDLMELDEVVNLSEAAYLNAAMKEQYSIIVGLGFYQDKAASLAAQKFSSQKIVLIDAYSPVSNVRGVQFREEENAFLAGVLSAHMAKTVGIVLGMDAPHLTRYAFSYEAGVKTINDKVNVLVDTVGNFVDKDKAKRITLDQIKRGASLVYQVAGKAGLGVLEAANEKGIYAIGEGLNQNHLYPKSIIASTYKSMGFAVYEAIKSTLEGTFKGGDFSYGFKEGYLTITLENSKVIVSEVTKQAVERYKQKLIDRTIIAPKNQTELNAYYKTLN